MANEYATVEKVKGRFSNSELVKYLSDNPASEKSVPDSRVQQYVDLANQMIDDALRVRYQLPLSNSNSEAVLGDIAMQIIRFNIITRKTVGDPPAGLASNYNDAMDRLEAYRTGELRLDANESPQKPSIINVSVREGGMSKILRNY